MDEKMKRKVKLDCLYDMFRGRIEENVVYIVYSENEGKIDTTIDQLMSISSCSFTGYHFEPPKPLLAHNALNNAATQRTFGSNGATSRGSNCLGYRSPTSENLSSSRAILGGPATKLAESSGKKNGNHQLDTMKVGEGEEKADDEESNLTVQEQIDKLQGSINDLLLEKQTSHDKASQYLTKKMYPVTSYYSEFASQLRHMIEVKTNKLVDLLLKKNENSDFIDLHGLNPVQARAVISEFLKIRQHKLMIDKQGEASIDIITGWGKHTVTQGKQRIRPTIVALLREKGLEYHYLNKGAIRVKIKR